MDKRSGHRAGSRIGCQRGPELGHPSHKQNGTPARTGPQAGPGQPRSLRTVPSKDPNSTRERQGQTSRVQSYQPSAVGVLVWWIGIAVVGGLIAAALIDVAYTRVIYIFGRDAGRRSAAVPSRVGSEPMADARDWLMDQKAVSHRPESPEGR